MKSFGNKYEHNLLWEYDSAIKVIKEKELIENKRKAKEKEKKATLFDKKWTKLIEKYKSTKRLWYEDGSANFENLQTSEYIESIISDIAKMSQKKYEIQIFKDSTKLNLN